MNDIDTLLQELSSFSPAQTPRTRDTEPKTVVTDDNLNDYVLKRATELVDTSMEAVREMKDYVIQGQNPEEIAALAELISASTRSMEILNKLNLAIKKSNHDIKIKKIDLEGKKEIAGMIQGNQNSGMGILASREEMMQKFLYNRNNDYIDAEIVKEDEEKPVETP